MPPPFKPTPLAQAIAAPGASPVGWSAPADRTPPQIRRRLRLRELSAHMHCSVIGTCLGTGELRKLVARFHLIDAVRASDLDVHHAAVELAVEGAEGAKAIEKLLESRHAAAVRRFAGAASPQELRELWKTAQGAGEVPGAYWAALTHPDASQELRHEVFGDVHMLSHLVGAANRAGIRRLIALGRENAELKEKSERQQARLRDMGLAHQGNVRRLSGQLAELTARRLSETADPAGALAELATLRKEMAVKDQQIAHQAGRREQAEQANAMQVQQLQRLQVEGEAARALARSLAAELAALERQVEGAEESGDGGPGLAELAGRHLLYVGGRPSTTAALRALCERAGIALKVHDGGIEDRKGLLEAEVPRAELVCFPVDCVDHDSMNRLKRLCQRHGVPYLPLRTAGVASFLAASAAYLVKRTDGGTAPASRFCLRNG